MLLFPDPAPPLLPVLDAAGLWSPRQVREIEAAREKLRRRFPQFRFHICTVMLPPETSLPVFGFWLLNVCPLCVGETTADREWSVLLAINARTGAVAAVPGYAAERWLSDDDWRKALAAMGTPWKSGDTSGAVLRFLTAAGNFLGDAWRTRGLRRTNSRKP